MGASGHYVHRIKNPSNVEFTTTYDSAKYIAVKLNADVKDGGSASNTRTRRIYSGNIQLIRLKGTIANGATSVILKGYGDVEGTELLLPPSQDTLENSIADATLSVVFKVDISHAAATDELYLFCKTNTGTFTVSEVQIAWYE